MPGCSIACLSLSLYLLNYGIPLEINHGRRFRLNKGLDFIGESKERGSQMLFNGRPVERSTGFIANVLILLRRQSSLKSHNLVKY